MDNHERYAQAPEQFKTKITEILSRSLTPESINTYADTALTDLVAVSDAASAAYDKSPTIAGETPKSAEDLAFSYFGLDKLDATLDHVARVANKIDRIDDIITAAATNKVNEVLLPHAKTEGAGIQLGSGEFKEKSLIPRLKTLLFILEQDFDIDIEDPEQISLVPGIVDDTLIRKTSYYSVEVPELKRLVLVDDEEENATFVFDTSLLQSLDLPVDTVRLLSKPELRSLIDGHDNLGTRIVYSRQFIQNLKSAIAEIPSTSEAIDQTNAVENLYLLPPASELKSAKSAAKELGISREKFVKIAESLHAEMGAVVEHRFGSVTTDGYDDRQVQLVRDYLLANEREVAPDSIASRQAIADRLDTTSYTVQQAIDALVAELGEVKEYSFGNRPGFGYDERQQRLIEHWLVSEGKINVEKAPEGYKSIKALAEELGVARPTIADAIANIGEAFGQIRQYRFIGMITGGLSPEQQQMVRSYLETERAPLAPEGVLSETGLAAKFDVSEKTIRRAATELSDKLGDVKDYRFGAKTTSGYSPEQQDIIGAWLVENNYLGVETAPEGYESAGSLSKLLKIDYEKLVEVIDKIKSSLGELKYYRFGTRRTIGYSPEQQQIIKDYLAEHATESAPEGTITEFGIAKKYSLGRSAVASAIKSLQASLGTPRSYQFSSGAVNRGFNVQEQELISAQAAARQRVTEE